VSQPGCPPLMVTASRSGLRPRTVIRPACASYLQGICPRLEPRLSASPHRRHFWGPVYLRLDIQAVRQDDGNAWGKGFNSELTLSYGSVFTDQVSLTYNLRGGHDYKLHQVADCDGLLWAPVASRQRRSPKPSTRHKSRKR
jgi:hypothetical protein